MPEQKPEPSSSETRVLEALAAAAKQYQEAVDLAHLGQFASQNNVEALSYQRTWKHPLGLVISK